MTKTIGIDFMITADQPVAEIYALISGLTQLAAKAGAAIVNTTVRREGDMFSVDWTIKAEAE